MAKLDHSGALATIPELLKVTQSRIQVVHIEKSEATDIPSWDLTTSFPGPLLSFLWNEVGDFDHADNNVPLR